MTEPRDIQALLAQARDGDGSAFGELCRSQEAVLEARIRSLLGPGLRAKIQPEDILQETFLRAFESLDRFREEDAAMFLRWLTSIAEHLIWSASQKSALKETSLTADVRGSHVSPSHGLRREERLERLRRSLGRLRPEQRTAIELAKLEGLKVKEIARRMGRSEDSVKQLLSRGLNALRERFGDTESLHLPERDLRGEGHDSGS